MKALKPALMGIAAIGILLFVLSFWVESLDSISWYALLIGTAALSFIPNSRVIRAAVGTGVLAALVFFGIQLLDMTRVGRTNIDLTEDDRFTLTEGTEAILKELEDPVVINYYVTRDLRSTPADVTRYIPRVDNLLEEFAGLANNDNLTINFIDPKPNTDEEDAAALDQIQQVPVSQEENLFFGATVTCWDKKTVIPFFNPESETGLEHDLIMAIAEVSLRNKPTVAIVSPLNVTSGGQTGEGWIFTSVARRVYNVIDLGMGITDRLDGIYEENEWGEAPKHLDPAIVPVVLLIHPAAITPEAEYALDQYLLRGGTVIACVDSYSIAAQQSARQQPQIPGMPPQQQAGGVPTQSDLPKLFEHLKVKFSGGEVLADGKFGMRNNPTILNLDRQAMPIEDDLSLAAINQILLGYAGGFEEVNTEGLEISRLIRSSRRADLVSSADALNDRTASRLTQKLRSDDRQYDILVHLSGDFTTAFPEGDPAKAEKKDAEEADTETGDSLSTASGKGHLYLFSDSDFLYDGAAYRMLSLGGQRGAGVPQAISDNAPLVFNLLDQAVNSKHLVGARARTPNWRPFTVFQDMKAAADEKTGIEVEKIEETRQKYNDEITKIMSRRDQSGAVRLTEADQARIEELREEATNANKQIRELQKDNQSEMDAVKAGIFWKSVVAVPILVILIGLGVFIFRAIRTQAR